MSIGHQRRKNEAQRWSSCRHGNGLWNSNAGSERAGTSGGDFTDQQHRRRNFALPAGLADPAPASSTAADALVSTIGPTDITVPREGGTASFESKGAKLTISLPVADDAQAVPTSEGAVLKSNNDSSVAVQATGDGLRALSVLENDSAPKTYSYAFQGASLFPDGKSGYDVIQNMVVVAHVAPAWAKDANGRTVKTWYSADGSVLTQHVDTEGAAFPVVADPWIADHGWTIFTVGLNAKDQRIIASGYGTAAGAIIGAVICSELTVGAAACAIIGGVVGNVAANIIKEYGIRENCNVYIKVHYWGSIAGSYIRCS